MIINAHSHISTNPHASFFYPDFCIENLINDLDQNRIQYAIVCLNPKILSLLCPNDCSSSCPVFGNLHELNKCNFDCPHAKVHWMKIFDSLPGLLKAQCLVCNKIIYEGLDPCHNYNIEFLSQCSYYKGRLFPLLYLHLANSSLNDEIDFFETHFSEQFIGYKFHPQTDMRCLDEICKVNSTRPILIHTGLRNVDNSISALNFAKSYKGNVVLAHACRLNISTLKEIKHYSNTYVDLSPSYTLFHSKEYALSPEIHSKVKSPQDIYKIVLEYVPIERIIFGSDIPWGNTHEELKVLSALELSVGDKEKILFSNAMTAYGLKL